MITDLKYVELDTEIFLTAHIQTGIWKVMKNSTWPWIWRSSVATAIFVISSLWSLTLLCGNRHRDLFNSTNPAWDMEGGGMASVPYLPPYHSRFDKPWTMLNSSRESWKHSTCKSNTNTSEDSYRKSVSHQSINQKNILLITTILKFSTRTGLWFEGLALNPKSQYVTVFLSFCFGHLMIRSF